MARNLEKTVFVDNHITETWYSILPTIIDQVFKEHPFWDKLVEGGKIKGKAPDGTHWEETVAYDKQDSNFQWIGRGSKFGRESKETRTRLMYNVRNAGTSMVRYWEDEKKNKGKAKLIDYAETVVTETKDALVDKLATCLLVQDSNPLAMNALPTIVSAAPTSGSIGGLTRIDNAYLQNWTENFTGKDTASSLLDAMRTVYNKCTVYKGTGVRKAPNLILTTRKIYQDYERLANLMGTYEFGINSSRRVDLGLGELLFKGAEIFWDDDVAAGNMYMLNTDTLSLKYDPDTWFEMTEWKTDTDTLDRVAQIVLRLNLTCNHFRKNGLIYNITPVST